MTAETNAIKGEPATAKTQSVSGANTASSKVDIKTLFEAGAHFGHKTSRWHPKMAPYIHSEREKSHIINLEKTVELLGKTLPVIIDSVSRGKKVLLVGTKRQASDIVRQAAKEVKMPYVTNRWIGGMLTNRSTISGQIRNLKSLESRLESGELESRYNKLEVQRFREEIERLETAYGGIKDMAGLPGVVFVTDIKHDNLAVKEANRLNIPVVGLVDTNCDPAPINYPIPANDDAIKTIQLITNYIVDAIRAGQAKIKTNDKEGGDKS